MIPILDLSYYIKYNKVNTNTSSLQNMSDSLSLQYDNAISSFDILINSSRANTIYKYKNTTPIKCIVDYNFNWNKNNVKNANNLNIRELWANHNVLQVGEVIDFENKVSKEKKTYVLTRQIENEQGYDIFQIQETTHILKWLNSKGDICSSPVIVESATKYSDGTWENAKIKIGDTRVLITFPANDETNQIQIGKRFLIDKDHAYEVSDTGVTSPKGLRQMVLTQTEIHQGVDNLSDDLLIADYHGNAHEYSIEIINKSIVLTKNSTCKLQVNVLDKGVKIDNPELIFDVINKDIVSSTEDTITGLNKGNTSIIVRFKDITDTINIEVTEVVTPDVYNIEILGKDSLALNRSTTYSVKIFKNGIEESLNSIIWNITDENNDVTNYASIVSSDDSKCTVKTTKDWIFKDNTSKYFYLHCKSIIGNVEGVKKVKITAN